MMRMVQRIEQITAMFDITRALIESSRMYHDLAKDTMPEAMQPILEPLKARTDRAEVALERAVRAYAGLPVDDRVSAPLTEQDSDIRG